jgi:hypothetical protein
VKVEQKDLFTADLGQADVVTLYLTPRMLERLLPQLAWTLSQASRNRPLGRSGGSCPSVSS